MAVPSRFDPSSPNSITGATFSTARKGYSPDEVRAALAATAAEIGRLQERTRQLEGELAHARTEGARSVELDEAALTARVGEETVRVLQTARESASQIKSRAEENAARLVAEASDEVNRMRHDADLEVSRKRADAASDAEAEVALAKQQGREMVNEARAYRERVLADLEARTARARQQLEELAHGRERLLQVFERARLVAIDVSTELGKHPGPTDLVNLANVTGPVPVTLPGGPRPDVGLDDRSVAELATDPAPHAVPDAPTEAVAVVDGAAAATIPDAGADAELPAADDVDDAADDADPADDADAADGDPVEGAGDGDAAPDDELVVVDDVVIAEVIVEPDGTTDVVVTEVIVAEVVESEAPAAEPAATGPTADEAGAPDNVVALFARLRQESTEPAVAAEPGHTAVAVLHTEPAGDLDEADIATEETPFSRRDEALVPLIVTAARKLKRVLADEQNGVLDVLRGRQSITSVAGLLPGADAHAAGYVDTIADELAAAAAAGAAEAGGSLRSKSGALDGARQQLAGQLVGALRDRLDRSVAAGAGDNADVTRGVRNVYREWKTQHIDEQLDDVFRAAYAGGAAAVIAPGTAVAWLVEPGSTCCADCADNTLAGAIHAGTEFPTGHTAAPAHAGCACLVLPV